MLCGKDSRASGKKSFLIMFTCNTKQEMPSKYFFIDRTHQKRNDEWKLKEKNKPHATCAWLLLGSPYMITFALEKFIQFLHYLKLSFFNSDLFFHLNVLFQVVEMLPIQTWDHRKLLLGYLGCSKREHLFFKKNYFNSLMFIVFQKLSSWKFG